MLTGLLPLVSKASVTLLIFFGADEKKISVVYQGCNSIFWNSVDNDKKQAVRKAYRLTNTFFCCMWEL